MINRAVARPSALWIVAIVTIVAIACGSSAGTPTEPTAEADPTAGEARPAGPRGEGLPPGLSPEGRGGAPGLGRGTRFVPLDNPEFVSANAATFLEPEDRVLGLEVGGESRAYPISMMTFHHVANDELGGLPVLVTF